MNIFLRLTDLSHLSGVGHYRLVETMGIEPTTS